MKNLNAQPLEIGEMSLPFVSNSDFTGILRTKAWNNMRDGEG